MPYQLELHERLSEGIKRVAAEEVESALKSLQGDGPDGPGEAIHDARKRFKKLRAALRLVEQDLGKKRYRRTNALFRDAGQQLSGLRDAQVLVTTLDGLSEHFTDQVYKRAFDGVRKTLLERQHAATARMDALTDEVVAKLTPVGDEIASWPIGDDWSAIGPNVKRVYGRGQEGFKEAYRAPSEESFHAWRKRVKDLWYHLRLLHPLWPPLMAALAEQASHLADLLGAEHDLAVLSQTLAKDPAAFGNPTELEALAALAEGRRKELRAEAEPLGRRLYAEGPKGFSRRFEAYWEAWRMEAQA